ncbi:hypothetical protein SteCoe_6897 [Stentor coeruleus]|uniref:Uncharacterized protein n=1 Tax=Stentor coeruleus TaxID=5963 RepID=A0A1R2CNY7_9CILI|nr:hypothetical protein SteCoe_6897 [Stentor coeruleus]
MYHAVKSCHTPNKLTKNYRKKSTTPLKYIETPQPKTLTKLRQSTTPIPQRNARPHSENQSMDFTLNSSKMFTKADFVREKFSPDGIPTPKFDVHACREEINRLESEINSSFLFESKLMREDWRKAKHSVDLQTQNEVREHMSFNTQMNMNFKSFQDNQVKYCKISERKMIENEFQAAKEVKLKLEIENRKKMHDDLMREKNKHLQRQDALEQRRQQRKNEKEQERESFKEFVGVLKENMRREQMRCNKERDFGYAQEVGAKWMKLHSVDKQVKENLQIVDKLINK